MEPMGKPYINPKLQVLFFGYLGLSPRSLLAHLGSGRYLHHGLKAHGSLQALFRGGFRVYRV